LGKSIVTIGGGIAGIEASGILAELGYAVSVIEKEPEFGGKLRFWDQLFPNMRKAGEIEEYLAKKSKTPGITLFPNTSITSFETMKNGFALKSNHGVSYNAHAVIVATGFDVFKAERKEEYGYKIYDNVITSADLEKKMKAGQAITTMAGNTPKRIAFIHCVGSRDAKVGNTYCSKVCCVTGVKQAIELNMILPQTQIFNFYMDLRMHGLEHEEIYKTAQEKHNIQFIRGRLSEVSENIDHSLLIKAEDTLSGRPLKMNVDMVVLLVGMEPGEGTKAIGKSCNLEFSQYGFLKIPDVHLAGNLTSRKGIFVAGTCSCPMSVKDTIEHARSAAFEVHRYLIEN
jgi:heterodisulfide reductase subunit A